MSTGDFCWYAAADFVSQKIRKGKLELRAVCPFFIILLKRGEILLSSPLERGCCHVRDVGPAFAGPVDHVRSWNANLCYSGPAT